MKTQKELLFIGDSLIEFYDWQARFPGHQVFNLGIAGETVDGLYARLKRVCDEISDPDFIFIMTGINDLAMEGENIVPVYRKVVNGFIDRYPAAGVFVHSLLPVLFPLISNDEIRGVNLELKKMTKEETAVYIDLHSLFLNTDGSPVPAFLLDDGVHLSEEGYRVWSREIERLIL